MNDSTRSQRVTYARKTCECEQAKSHEAEEVEAIQQQSKHNVLHRKSWGSRLNIGMCLTHNFELMP